MGRIRITVQDWVRATVGPVGDNVRIRVRVRVTVGVGVMVDVASE